MERLQHSVIFEKVAMVPRLGAADADADDDDSDRLRDREPNDIRDSLRGRAHFVAAAGFPLATLG